MVLMGLQIRMFELLQWKIVFVHCHPVQHLPRNGPTSPCEIASVLPALLLPSLWFANQELNAPPSKSTHVQDVHVHHVHHFRSTEKQTISCCRGGNRRVLRLSLNYRLKSWSMLSLLGLRRGPVPYHKEGVEETDSLGLWQGDWTVSQTTRIWIWWQPTNLKSVGNSTAKWTATCDAIPVTPLRGLVPFFLKHRLFLWKFKKFEEQRIDPIKAGARQKARKHAVQRIQSLACAPMDLPDSMRPP